MKTDTEKAELISSLNSETQLLLRCFNLQANLQSDDFAHIDMDRFVHVLDCHRLSTSVYPLIKDNPVLPVLTKTKLRERYVNNKLRMLAYMAELCRVLALLQHNGIQAISLKGPVLSHLYYDDYTQRECGDLDILVRPSDVEAAYQLLLDTGYALSDVLWNSPKQKVLYEKYFHHYNVYNPIRNIQIELHWKLTSSIDSEKKLIEANWNNTIGQNIGGLSVKVLAPHDNFIYLCIHGGVHQWKRLFWVQDIARIIQKEGSDFIEAACQRAVENGVKRYVLEGCHLSYILFNSALPDRIHTAIEQDEKISNLSVISVFAMNDVADQSLNASSSVSRINSSLRKLLYAYQSTYYLGGIAAVVTLFKKFFINSDYWAIYSFPDKFFIFNYVAAPFLWINSFFNKGNQ